jgi:HPt (histidine-containing phosphotransfer) domain-containing protein
MALLHLDYDLVHELASLLEEEFPILVNTFIENSNQLLKKLPQLLDEGDIKTFIRHVHSLKGSSRNLGAEHLADLCLNYENLANQGKFDHIDPQFTAIRTELDKVSESLTRYAKR